jgi:peroxiredoxin Q/BCP
VRTIPLLVLVAAAVGATLAVRGVARAEEEAVEAQEVRVGDTPGAFALNDENGRAVRLGDGEGHGWFVLAFYPKAMTGGCTREVCSLRDVATELSRHQVRVFGISLDEVASQRRFVEEQGLNFPLLSDPDGSVARRYRTLIEGGKYTSRTTFVVDPKGVVRHVDRAVKVDSHGADLVGVVSRLLEAPR